MTLSWFLVSFFSDLFPALSEYPSWVANARYMFFVEMLLVAFWWIAYIYILINSWPLFKIEVTFTNFTAGVTFFVVKHYSIFLGVVKVKVGRGSWDFRRGKGGSRARCWGCWGGGCGLRAGSRSSWCRAGVCSRDGSSRGSWCSRGNWPMCGIGWGMVLAI